MAVAPKALHRGLDGGDDGGHDRGLPRGHVVVGPARHVRVVPLAPHLGELGAAHPEVHVDRVARGQGPFAEEPFTTRARRPGHHSRPRGAVSDRRSMNGTAPEPTMGSTPFHRSMALAWSTS